MKRIVCLALVLLMLAAACVGAAAETVTALDGKPNGSNENVLFSGGYRGYCIDRDKHGAVKDDVFSVAENTAAAAISNTIPPTDISQKLKILFTQCFDQIFEANETGEYLLKEGMSNILLGAVYHYSEGQYVWGEQEKLTKTVDEYKGDPVPDDGYCLELDNGDIVTFSFKVFEPYMIVTSTSNGTQTFFAYKLTVEHPDEPETYTVTVTTDGNGTGSANPTSGATGTEVTLNATPNSGYQFKEWQVISGGVTVTDNKFTIGTQNVEIKAIFEEIPETIYTVTVTNDGNGTGSANPTSGETGTEVTLSAAPNSGYQFKEWQVISGGVTVTDNKFTIGTQNVEIKAIFEEIPETIYTVTVTNDGNGTGSVNPASGATGTEVTLSATPKSGYQFKEWEVVSGGVTVADNKFTIGTENVEIKAIFEKIPEETIYTVTITNDGNGTGSANPASGETGTEVTLSAAPKEGYQFKAWEVVTGGVTVADNKFTIGTQNIEIKAIFEEIPEVTYTVTVTNDGNGTGSANPASGETGTEVTLNAAPKEGYQFKAWEVVSGGVTVADNKFTIGTQNVEIKAIFEKIPETIYTVTVTNDGNGTGSANPASGETGTEVTLNAAPKEGYQFKAWEVVSGGVTVADNKFTIGTQNVEIKAIFEKIPEEYDVTVSREGVGAVVPNPASAAEGEEVTLHVEAGSGYRLASLTINGEEKAGDVQNNLYIFKMPKGGAEIQAVFEAIPEELYTVTFNANGGSGEMADQMFEDGVKQPLRKNAFIRGGYTFTGWNTKADGAGTDYADEQSVTVAGNMTLYASWKKDASLLRITRQPQDQFVTEGQKAEFAVEAEGDGLTYQWYVDRGDGKGLVELKGAEDASYVTSATNLSNDGYVYVCEVTDENGHSVTSEAAVLHVSELPVLPQTGDSSAPALYLALGMLSVLGLAVLGKKSCIR